jgi:predicted ATPase/class 3 adenylate cyclase
VPNRPSGIVSFLFSDVVGSTRLWEADREGMAASLASHDRIMKRSIGDLGGYVFSTAGDSFAAAFPSPSAALSAAVRAQMGLMGEAWPGPPIRVRMGVHTGTSFERGGDYFGPDVNRAARVMAAANAGQVLVSRETAQLVGGSVEAPLSLIDRGVHSLKDLDRPEHLFELTHPELPEVSDPLRTALVERIHLPARLTSFVGRGTEIEAVKGLIHSSRLVTLTGVGGAGKTRLALEAASDLEEDFPDGIWMAGLADIFDPSLVVNEIAEVWGLRPGDGMRLLPVIRAFLSVRQLLLVLDNCEHVLAAAGELATDLLASSPGLHILATSRETLGAPGETVYRVPSLGLPAGDDVASSESVRLFVDRAALVQPGFSPTQEELEGIARICRRLDGIPLGIELAAARIRTLTIGDLATQLEDSFRVLTAASKTAVRRQRTLENTIGWSYDLLSDDEAALFRRLSVFAGGFDLAAAQAMARGPEVLDLLDQLVDKSLVVTMHDQGSRFRLLEPIRQYGHMRLTEHDEAEEARISHAAHYASVVAAISPRLRGPEQAQANRELLVEADNTREALATFLDRGEIDRFLQTCFDLTWFWAQSSLQVEGRDRLVAALGEYGASASPGLAAKAWLEATLLATFLTDPAATEFADRGLKRAEESGDEAMIGWLTLARGMAYSNLVGHEDAGSWMEEGGRLLAMNLDRPMWDTTWDEALVEFMLAFGQAGTAEERREHVSGAINRALEVGDGYLAAAGMMTSTSLIGTGQDDWVLANLARSIEILGDLGSRHGLGHALYYHGAASQDLGMATPVDDLADASRILAEVGDLPCSTRSGARSMRILIDAGRREEAIEQLRAAAGRLLLFDGEVHAGLPALALRLSLDGGDMSGAARFLGHVEQDRVGISQEAVATARAKILLELPEADSDRLLAEGATAGYRRVLEWIRDM